VHTRGKPLAADVDLAALAGTASERCSGADIELICRKASLAAIREFLESPAARSTTLEGFVIRAEHFHTAMLELGAERSEKPGREVAH
jgi:transitional endoplasmic reticulum ATPase